MEAIKPYRSRSQNGIVVLPDITDSGGGGGGGGDGDGDRGGYVGGNFIFKPHNDWSRYNRYADDVRSADLPIFKPHLVLHFFCIFFFLLFSLFALLHMCIYIYIYIYIRVHARKIPYECKCTLYVYVYSTVLKSRRCQWLANITECILPISPPRPISHPSSRLTSHDTVDTCSIPSMQHTCSSQPSVITNPPTALGRTFCCSHSFCLLR